MDVGVFATSCSAFANFCSVAERPVVVFAEEIVDALDLGAEGVEAAETARGGARLLREQRRRRSGASS